MIFKTLITIASLLVVAAIIGSSITVYLSAPRTIVKVGYWNNGNNFTYSSLLETFDKIATGQLTYKNVSFSKRSSTTLLTSFETYDGSIYVTDNQNGAFGWIITFDSNWKEKSNFAIWSPQFLKQINDEFYSSEASLLCRRSTVDFSCNFTQGQSTLYPLRNIYYDQSTYTFICPSILGLEVYNLALSPVRVLSIPDNGTAHSVYGYNGMYYAGVLTANRTSIVAFKDNMFVGRFELTDRCTNSTIIQLLYDAQGFVAGICAEEKTIYIYHNSGAYTGRSLTFASTPNYINYDSNGRFVVLEEQRIRVYS